MGRCKERIGSSFCQSRTDFDYGNKTDGDRFLLMQRTTGQYWINHVYLYVPTLLRNQEGHCKPKEMKIDDICVINDLNSMRDKWKLCQIMEIRPNRKGGDMTVKVTLTSAGG